MPESKQSKWLAAIAAESKHPQASPHMRPEDRMLRLYPQYTTWVRQLPIRLESLLAETRPDIFITRLYQHLLLRDPDPAGYSHNLERLQRGDISPMKLVLEFRYGCEGKKAKRKIDGIKLLRLRHMLRPFIPNFLAGRKVFF